MKKFINALLPSCVWLFPLLLCEGLSFSLALLCSVFVHECGHLLAFRLTGAGAPRLIGSPVGLILMPRCVLSYKSELIIAAFGPLCNLLFTFLLMLLFPASNGAAMVAGTSACSAVCNLFPISTLDGGRICSCILSLFFHEETARNISQAISFIVLACALFFSLGLILMYDCGYNIFFFIAALIALSDKNKR